jgi:hypothetical protein
LLIVDCCKEKPMAKKKLLAEPTTHDMVEEIVKLQTRARALYGKIDPLLSEITKRCLANPDAPRVFEVEGQQYEWQDRFAGDRAKVRVDQYVARYLIQASR